MIDFIYDMEKEILVEVEITHEYEPLEIEKASVEELVRYVCGRYKVVDAWVSIVILDDAGITDVNAKFLDHHYNTDVISFDLSDDYDANSQRVFELIVNGEKAVTEAKARGHRPDAELSLYIVHGLLHNFGFDDQQPEQASKMHEAEDEILKRFGFGFVYNS